MHTVSSARLRRAYGLQCPFAAGASAGVFTKSPRPTCPQAHADRASPGQRIPRAAHPQGRALLLPRQKTGRALTCRSGCSSCSTPGSSAQSRPQRSSSLWAVGSRRARDARVRGVMRGRACAARLLARLLAPAQSRPQSSFSLWAVSSSAPSMHAHVCTRVAHVRGAMQGMCLHPSLLPRLGGPALCAPLLVSPALHVPLWAASPCACASSGLTRVKA